MELLILGIASALGSAVLWARIRYGIERAHARRALAEQCGLTDIVEPRRLSLSGDLEARSGALRVSIGEYQRREQEHGTTLSIENPESAFAVNIQIEDSGTARRKLFGAREIEVGDSTFDAEFYLGGSTSVVLALLDAQTRRMLLTLGTANLHVTSRLIRAEIPDRALGIDLIRMASRQVRLLLDVARRLSRSIDVAPVLAQNATLDPIPGVRLQNLLCLIREFPEHPTTQETLRAAAKDDDPEVRIRAATALGHEGVEVLLGVAEDKDTEDVYAAAAVSALDRYLPLDRARRILERALRDRRIETARACLAALGRSGVEAAVGPLVKVLAVESGDLAMTAARALGVLRMPASEPALIEALSRSGPRLSAAEALGELGTVAAVVALKDAAEIDGHHGFRRAAREAVAKIQSRAVGASPGQLSIATGEVGQLSIAVSNVGQLSFPSAESGRLSLPAATGGRLTLAEGRGRPESGSS